MCEIITVAVLLLSNTWTAFVVVVVVVVDSVHFPL